MTASPALCAALVTALREVSEALLLVHTNPWDLDEAVLSAGFRTGVFAAWDIDGLVPARQTSASYGVVNLPVVHRMLAEGRAGRAAGVGWYRYPGGGGLVIDPLVEDLLREEARFAGVTRVDLEGTALAGRLITGLTNAAAWLVTRNGQAPEEIDRACDATGMPPLFALADQRGAQGLQADLAAQAETLPWLPGPAPVILQTAAVSGRFRTG